MAAPPFLAGAAALPITPLPEHLEDRLYLGGYDGYLGRPAGGVVPSSSSSLQAAKARTAASARTDTRREIRLRLRGDMYPSLRVDHGILSDG